MAKGKIIPLRKPLSYIVSVSLEVGCYRHIQIGADSTLEQLHETILKEFAFDDDHLHAFFMTNRAWDDDACYFSKHAEDEPFTDKVTLTKAGFVEGKKFLYIFDFGEEWRFDCRVLRQIEEPTLKPVCVRSKGDPPAQYADDEDWDDDEEWDDEALAEQMDQLRQVWRQLAIKTVKPAETLREMLACRDKAELVQMLGFFGAKKISSWSKDKLIEGVASYLVKPEILRDRLCSLGREQWSLFCKAATQPMLTLQEQEVDLCAVPHILGLLQPYRQGGQYLCVVPQEIRAVYSKLLTEGLQEDYDRRWLLYTYALAATNLYGILPVTEFIQIFNDQNSAQTDPHEVQTVLSQLMLTQEAPYCLWKDNDYLAHEVLWVGDFAAAEDHLAKVKGKPRYIPSKDELLRYADMDYFEKTPQIKAVGNYFALQHGLAADALAELFEQLHMFAFFEHQPNEVFELLANRGIVMNVKRINECLPLLTDVFNNTRTWLNKGHTPTEMFQLQNGTPPQPLHFPVKVGRNEPCPCGSGKKYKHCCER